jgi:hypothetical protein
MQSTEPKWTKSSPDSKRSSDSVIIRLAALAALVVVIMGLLYVGFRVVTLAREAPARITDRVVGRREEVVDLGAVVTRLRSLNRLETAAMRVMHVGRIDQSYGVIPNGLAGDSITFLAVGDVVAGVDLSRLAKGDVSREEGGTVVVHLPPSEILVTRVDNTASRVINRQTGMFRRADPQLEGRARMYAEGAIRREALQKGILATAAGNAEERLAELLHSTGVARVRFEKRAMPAE